MRQLWQTTYTLLLAFVVLAINSAQAKDINEQKVNDMIFMYNQALESDNVGLIESGIYNVMLMKFRYPDEDYEELVETIDELSLEGETIKIRYRAQLAGIYLKHSEMFKDIEMKSIEDPTVIFQTLADRVEKVAFSTASL
jgi:hypothetical protein